MSENQTVEQKIRALAESNTSSSEDDLFARLILSKFYPNVVVTYGVVYLEGRGQAISIQQAMQILVKVIDTHREQTADKRSAEVTQ